MSFVKLDVGILESTIWFDRDARDVFLTALLMAEPIEFTEEQPQVDVHSLEPTGWAVPPGWYGFVAASGPGIVRRAGLEEIQTGLDALDRLGEPEVDSRSIEFEGRRLVRINHGYVVLNYMRYRDRDHSASKRMWRLRRRRKGLSEDEIKEEEGKRYGVTPVTFPRTSVTVTHADADADADAETTTTRTTLNDLTTDFAAWWAHYPKRAGGNPRKPAQKAYLARRKAGVTTDALLRGVQAYRAYLEATGKLGTEYVKQAQFWLGPSYAGWEQEWTIPSNDSTLGHEDQDFERAPEDFRLYGTS